VRIAAISVLADGDPPSWPERLERCIRGGSSTGRSLPAEIVGRRPEPGSGAPVGTADRSGSSCSSVGDGRPRAVFARPQNLALQARPPTDRRVLDETTASRRTGWLVGDRRGRSQLDRWQLVAAPVLPLRAEGAEVQCRVPRDRAFDTEVPTTAPRSAPWGSGRAANFAARTERLRGGCSGWPYERNDWAQRLRPRMGRLRTFDLVLPPPSRGRQGIVLRAGRPR
jgi:hypothetical protein